MSRWLSVIALLGGCAFSLEGPDPNRPRHTLPTCDTSKGLVALDGVMASALTVTALSVAGESEPALALLPLGLAALYVGGAVSGNRSVNSCREAVALYETEYGGERARFANNEEEEQEDDRPRRRKKLLPREQPPVYAGAQPGYPQAPQQYPQQPYPEQQPPPPQQPQQQQQQPQPPPQQPAQPQPPPPGKAKPAPPAEPEAPADEQWSDFWREVP